MIKNVNLMQNPQDIIWDKESEYSREHLIQALANLGQRIGIKGDGISYKSFTFNDILDKTYSASQYVGFIEYFRDSDSNDLKAKFGVTDKYNIYNSNNEQILEISQNINNAFIFPSDLTFSLPVNFLVSSFNDFDNDSSLYNSFICFSTKLFHSLKLEITVPSFKTIV